MVLYQIKYSEPNISAAAFVSPLAFAVLLLVVYQTALHCCGRPLLDWGWIACIRRKASCTEPRCLYRDGSIRIHVPCHPYNIYIYIRGGTVLLFHGSVCITVLESRFRYSSVCLGKTILSIKDKKIRIIYVTTKHSTNKYNRVKIQKNNSDVQFFFFWSIAIVF